MRRTFPSATFLSPIFLALTSRTRVSGLTLAFLLISGAAAVIGSVPAAEAQDFGPNFADACFGNSLVVVKGVRPDSTGTKMMLTDGGLNETSAVYCTFSKTTTDGSFATTFTFQITDAAADGFTFAVIDPDALSEDPPAGGIGGGGGGLGYKGLTSDQCDPTGSGGNGCSVALKFDLYSNQGEGPNSTGLYTYGATPTVPSINLAGTGIDLHSGHPINALVTFNGTTHNLILTLTDTVSEAKWSHQFTVDITSIVGNFPGAFTPYDYGLGFTAATGGESSTQEILSWNTALYYPSYPAIAYNDLAYGGSAGDTYSPSAPALFDITQGAKNQAGSAYYTTPLDVRKFVSDFTFKTLSGQADGFTFVVGGLSTITHVHGFASGAVGRLGGGLGYAGIPKSVAVKFDLFNNQGEGPNSTGLYLNGAVPTVPSVDLTGSGIDLHSPDVFHAYITYDGTTLHLTITDTVTGAKFTHEFPVDIPGTIGSSTGYAGFTGGTGANTSTIQILTWTYWGGLTESPE